MNNQEIYKYENIIDYNIDAVKDAIRFILNRYKVRFNIEPWNEHKVFNDLANTYNFNEEYTSYVVVLVKVDDEHTKLSITTTPSASIYGYECLERIEKYTLDIVNILTSQLSGVNEYELDNIEEANNTCNDDIKSRAWGGLILMAISGIIWWLIL